MAAGLVFILLLLPMAQHSSGNWCVCKEGMSDATLQKTLDFACGAGADCNPTHQNGRCYNPNTVKAHCSYAVNSYFQRHRQDPAACNFSGTANAVTSDPSAAGCAYPATASSTPTSTTPVTTVSGTPNTTTTNGSTPLMTTPSGVLGGSNNGLGPSGINDVSEGGIRSSQRFIFCFSILLAFALIPLE